MSRTRSAGKRVQVSHDWFWLLLLIGLKSGASFLSQSCNVVNAKLINKLTSVFHTSVLLLIMNVKEHCQSSYGSSRPYFSTLEEKTVLLQTNYKFYSFHRIEC